MRVIKKRVTIIDENLLAPLSENSGVGQYLRYDPLYDEIRQARKEEDETLSQGIWQHDLKKADFVTVEALCAEALEFRTKDIQIVSWLTDSWISLDSVEGFARGLALCKEMVSTYWSNIYPQEDEDGYEARVRLFEWMNEQFANRLMTVPLTYKSMTQEHAILTLADWLAALNTETIAKRAADYQKALDAVSAKGAITLSVFRKNLNTSDAKFLQKLFACTTKAQEELQELIVVIGKKLGKQATGFSRVKTCLDDILRIVKSTLEQRELPLFFDDVASDEEVLLTTAPPQTDYIQTQEALAPQKTTPAEDSLSKLEADGVRSISERKDAYQALREIGQFLQTLDPHSPAPSLLEIIVDWESKSLPDILESLSVAPSSTQRIIRMLSSALPDEYDAKK
ncbi:MAG: type VI secretion system protein TssA [Alphaproteobacteria bacterium CG_4_10_14_0_8_um_filter_37_21]|nr:MAG: type VI secretion system protein TssA [Alphaproteobacteria bacterium CG_4_10_14_0_8_um_filter_37_21]